MATPMQMTTRQPGLRYLAVAAELRRRIEEGDLQPGERLPGQHELSKQFGVSLTTMRAAIGILEQQGYLRPAHGLGTYVTKPGQKQIRALVVDDDPDAVKLLREVLEGAGAHVEGADCRSKALERVASSDFDVIFLDIVMPGGSGVETFADLRRQKVQSPVVLVTGVADADMITRASEHGPLTLIRKPVEVDQVREVLTTVAAARGERSGGRQ